MKRGIKAIIFDCNGVLMLGEGKGIHETVAKELKISLEKYFDAIDVPYARAIEGKDSSYKTMQIIANRLNIVPSKLKLIYFHAYKNRFEKNEELFEQAFKLKEQGYKIGILSDQWFLSRESLMPKKDYKNFDEVIISYKVGTRKPDTEIYKLILKRLELKPQETLFIDNREWNLAPAKKIGMETILFKDNKQLFKDKQWRSLFK